MAQSTEHFSGTVRTTKDDLRFGPLKVRRIPTSPANTYGRNGDFIIIDDTAESDENLAISRVPVDVQFCQKIPFVVTGGTFTITAASGVYTITIATMDDFIEQVTRAEIPELRVELTDPKTIGGGQNYLLHANSVTFADGTSDLPSVLGIAGLQAGEVTVPLGTWECFAVGAVGIDVESSGVPVAPGGFDTINFTGAGVSSIVDSGGGTVTVTISGGGAGGVAYGVIAGDSGPAATATAASELITFGGIGVTVVTTDSGAGLDTVSFNLDIADLPNGVGTPVSTDTIALNIGGTTEEYPLSALSSIFGGVAYGVITADVGSATATSATENITYSGTGITITAVNAGVGLDTVDWVLDIADLPAGAGSPTLTDTIAINIGGTTEEYPISALSSLFLGTAYSRIAGGDGGIAVAIGSDLITVNGTGINVVAVDAGVGLDTLGLVLDIADLPDGAGTLIPGDEIGVNDGGTTVRHTIEEVVDTVLPGVDVTTINSQPMLTLIDTTRGNKILSVAENNMIFSDNKLDDQDWMRIGEAADADSGYIAQFDGTLVYASAHCENTGANSKEIHLYIDGTDSATLGTLSGGTNATFNNTTLNVNFDQGDRIRLRAEDGSGGAIEDTVVKLTVKWRG